MAHDKRVEIRFLPAAKPRRTKSRKVAQGAKPKDSETPATPGKDGGVQQKTT